MTRFVDAFPRDFSPRSASRRPHASQTPPEEKSLGSSSGNIIFRGVPRVTRPSGIISRELRDRSASLDNSCSSSFLKTGQFMNNETALNPKPCSESISFRAY
ncbi:hypothetical protein QLX08_007986 [Tetragonisca angustula]|uniref:Uncharacterized protein n=1 Tax=Tetragonisca angustula TaxID=166442 RepID=A0AAW0ZP99_9HYME